VNVHLYEDHSIPGVSAYRVNGLPDGKSARITVSTVNGVVSIVRLPGTISIGPFTDLDSALTSLTEPA